MRASIDTWEWHNLVRRNGEIFVRPALKEVFSVVSSSSLVGGFTVESPNTTEPWHYTFTQTATGDTSLRVSNEEFGQVFAVALGTLPIRPIITYAVVNRQLMINSPSFSQPLYGFVGGGLIPAFKTASQNPDTTAIDIPTGHIASFGDRMVIAQGSTIYFNDPGIDPRTFTAQNTIAAPGTIYDMFQGPDGALYVFTSGEAMVIPQDALGKGQTVSGFVSTIPGLDVLHPRNAAVSNGVVAVLSRNGVVLVNRGMKHIPLKTYRGRRALSVPIEYTDARESGEIFATPDGFIVGFRQSGYFFDVNLKQDFTSCVYMESTTSTPVAPVFPLSLCGVLTSRSGDALLVCDSKVLMSLPGFRRDIDLYAVRGTACGYVGNPKEASGVVRHITASSDGTSGTVAIQTGGATSSKTVTTSTGDIVVGTSTWSASGTLEGRNLRSVRAEFSYRASQYPIEIRASPGGARLSASIDVQIIGQGRGRTDVE